MAVSLWHNRNKKEKWLTHPDTWSLPIYLLQLFSVSERYNDSQTTRRGVAQATGGVMSQVHNCVYNCCTLCRLQPEQQRHERHKEMATGFPTYFFFEPLWLFSVFSVDLSLEWLESLESTDSLDLSRLRSLSLCFLRRSISRRRSTGSSLYFPSAYKRRGEGGQSWTQGLQCPSSAPFTLLLTAQTSGELEFNWALINIPL